MYMYLGLLLVYFPYYRSWVLVYSPLVSTVFLSKNHQRCCALVVPSC